MGDQNKEKYEKKPFNDQSKPTEMASRAGKREWSICDRVQFASDWLKSGGSFPSQSNNVKKTKSIGTAPNKI